MSCFDLSGSFKQKDCVGFSFISSSDTGRRIAPASFSGENYFESQFGYQILDISETPYSRVAYLIMSKSRQDTIKFYNKNFIQIIYGGLIVL